MPPDPDSPAGPAPGQPESVPGQTEPVPGQTESVLWECGRCGIPLEVGKVKVAYLETEQPVDLASCPRCGMVMVPENLALGRMVEVEQLLEDK
jgi:ribosomal protein S27AE